MIREEWRPVVGFEKQYEVSDKGRVRNIKTGHILKPQIASKYAQVYFRVDGKQKWFKVHKLVAIAFIPNPNNYPYINHKDGNTINNNVSNLEWCTPKYNVVYSIILKNKLEIDIEEYDEYSKEQIKRYMRSYYRCNTDKYKKYYQAHKEKIKEKYREKKK